MKRHRKYPTNAARLVRTPIVWIGAVLAIVVAIVTLVSVSTTSVVSGADTVSSPLALIDPMQSPIPLVAAGGGSIDVVDGIALRSTTSPLGDADGSVWVHTQGQIAKYLVRPGDTVNHIAEMYDVSSRTIREHNNISGVIRAGDIIEILPVDGVAHTVYENDTIDALAKKYTVEAEHIRQYNNMRTALVVGETVIIPREYDGQGTHHDERAGKNSTPQQRAESYDIGEYIYPCDCIVTQGYGTSAFARRSGYYDQDHHDGVDFSSSIGTGTPIVAVAAGKVTKVKTGYNGGYGNYIVIKHDSGSESLYAHNDSNAVAVGQRVEQGQIIASMGTTGRVTGPHVHFELRKTSDNPFYETFAGTKGW